MDYENPFLRGMANAQQATERAQANELNRVQGILGIQNAVQQQGILAQKLADQQKQKAQIEAFAAQLPESERQRFMVSPQAYLQEMNKRYTVGGNLVTGQGQPVYQSPVENKIAPNGQVYNPREIMPGQSFQDPSKLVTIGPDGKPMVNPIALQARSQIAAAGKPSIVNKVDMAQETEENKTIGRELGQQYSDLQKGSMAAGGKIVKLNRMSQLLEGVNTGKLTPAMTEVAALGESLGIKVDPKLGAKQALEALSNEVALSLRSTADGGGMPGAMSDKDREFLKAMTPSLSKTPEGNKTIIETGVKLAKRQQEVAALAREYRAQNRTLEGFPQYMQKWADAHPMFGGGELAVGTVKDGYKFKGGNPADKNSWEKI